MRLCVTHIRKILTIHSFRNYSPTNPEKGVFKEDRSKKARIVFDQKENKFGVTERAHIDRSLTGP